MTDLGDCIVSLTADQGGVMAHANSPDGLARNAARGPAPKWIDLIPAGVFAGRDGRGPYRNDHPEQVIAATRKLGMTAGLPIDFDHAIDFGAPQGQPAPAAGWIKELRLVKGVIQGRVEWTRAGAKALAAKLYRYISPVFEFAADGTVERLLRAAVTNNPNLYLTAIAAATPTGASAAADENLRRAAHQMRASLGTPTAARLRAARKSLVRATAQAAARFLSADDLELCRMQGVDPARFAVARRERMTGQPLVMPTRSEERAAEAADRRAMGAADWVKLAMEEIARFLKEPEHLDALKHLINADAWLSEAIKRSDALRTTANAWRELRLSDLRTRRFDGLGHT